MKVALWAEIRRLAEIEKLSQRAIARRLRCCQRTLKKALDMPHPPDETRRAERGSILDPYKPKIQALMERCPELSAIRVLEELRKGCEPYAGRITVVRNPSRSISLATRTISSSDGVIRPDRPMMSTSRSLAVSRIVWAGTITPRSITS